MQGKGKVEKLSEESRSGHRKGGRGMRRFRQKDTRRVQRGGARCPSALEKERVENRRSPNNHGEDVKRRPSFSICAGRKKEGHSCWPAQSMPSKEVLTDPGGGASAGRVIQKKKDRS